MIKNEDTYCPAPKIAYRTIGGQVALVKPNENRFITLNETASFIWSRLETGSVASIAENLRREFDVSQDAALNDVKGFIEKLLSNELIVLQSVSPGDAG